MDQSEKVHENRLRRMAERQGYTLVKSRRRDPRALDYGRYWLVNARRPQRGNGMTLEEVERHLAGDA